MINNTIYEIRKTSSGLGFLLFAASMTMYTISIILAVMFSNKMDTTLLLLMDIIISIVSLCLVGIFYCWLSNTKLGETINVKWVRISLFVPLVVAALAVAFISDYLTELLLGTFSWFGIENSVELSTKTHTLIENILNIVAVAIIPPLVEEFLFRGVVLGKLRRFGDSFALFFSSILFALMHGNILQTPFTFIVGLALGFITLKSESLVPAMAVHFLVNLRSVMISICLDNNIIAEDTLNVIYLAFLLAVLVFGVISAVALSRKKDFFKLERNTDIPFRQAVKTSSLSVGMIFFYIHSLVTILGNMSISWLNFKGLY